MLFHRAVSKVLQSSLNFSVFLFVLSPNQGIRIQKNDRYLNKNQVSVAILKHIWYQKKSVSITKLSFSL